MSEQNREELERELADLEAQNAAAPGWGAAVGVRHERIIGIRKALDAVTAQGADGQSNSEPIAWIAFNDHGSVRFWTSDAGRATDEKARGMDLRAFTLAELVALAAASPRFDDGTEADDYTPAELAEMAQMVAKIMPFSGGGKLGAALRIYVRGCERSARWWAARTEIIENRALASIPPHLYWLIGKGRTRPKEPLYAVQLIDPESSIAIAEAEAEHLGDAITTAVAKLG